MLPALTGAEWAVALAVTAAAAFIRGLSGFGLALVLVPVLALTIDPTDAVIAANILGIVMGLASYRSARLSAESSARTIAIAAVLLTPLGLFALSVTPEAAARVIIALIAVSAYAAFLLPPPRNAWHRSMPLAATTGAACGLCAGFAGMPGPPVVTYYLGRRVEKGVARASMFIIFLATSVAACIAALALGVGSMDAIWAGALLSPVVLLGNWLGSLAFGKVSDLVWRLCAGAIVTAAAVVAITDAVGG